MTLFTTLVNNRSTLPTFGSMLNYKICNSYSATVGFYFNFRNLLLFLPLFLVLIFVPIDGQSPGSDQFTNSGEIAAPVTPVELQLCGHFLHVQNNNFSAINATKNTTTVIIRKAVLTPIIWKFPPAITADQSSQFTALLKSRNISCKEENSKEVTVYLNVTRLPGIYTEEFLANGYFRKDIDYFHPREYCISEISDTTVSVKICGTSCGPKNKIPCIPVCCPLRKLFSPGVKRVNTSQVPLTCVASHKRSSPLSPVLYTTPNKRVSQELPLHYRRKLIETFKCGNQSRPQLLAFSTNEDAIKTYGVQGLCYRIRVDGTLMYRNSYSEWSEVGREDYCLEGFQNGSSDQPFRGTEAEFGVLLCGLPSTEPFRFHSEFYGAVMIVSSIFLLLTLVVHILLWSQQNIHGWTIMCHAGSMFFMYLLLGTVSLIDSIYSYDITRTMGCKIIGIVTHFFFLSTFCWLTLINFDLFWTFKCMAPRSQRSKGLGRFMLYVLLGWGLPFIFVSSSVILDHIYGSAPCNMFITPEYGVSNCYVSKYSQGRYVYYPVALLWSVNLLFFVTTTYKLYIYKKSTRFATQNLKEHQQLFQLSTKLFFVMGFTWIFEFLSWFLAGNEIEWYWTIFDFINLLQAVAIFIIFVCKPDIISALQSNYPMLKLPWKSTPKTGTTLTESN